MLVARARDAGDQHPARPQSVAARAAAAVGQLQAAPLGRGRLSTLLSVTFVNTVYKLDPVSNPDSRFRKANRAQPCGEGTY